MNLQLIINPDRVGNVPESQRFAAPADGHAYAEGSQATARLATDANREAVELRLALLSRAIEDEIIPRLMLAHPGAGDCLPLTPPASTQVSLEDVRSFAQLVLAPDENVAHACIETMRASGISVETIYTDLLAPVARYLGELWEDDLCDFTQVTVGLGRLQQVLRELSPAFGQSNASTSGNRVLLLPGPGEQHTFGLVMVAEFFRRAGWDVAGGPWEAGADPIVMVQREWFDVVGFSLGNVAQLDDLAACIKSVRAAALNKSICVIVGGPLFLANPEYVAYVNADAASTDGAHAPELAAKLVSAHTRSSSSETNAVS
ncbi:MAG: cobalamin B12-binding domain-containing protein [Polaromonas sp.]|nr:cobalamin B12-binding domain-containing protein [Polaromonas sp.]